MKETKRQSHPELYILLALGIKPQTLISRGYSSNTVYKYNKAIPEIKKKIDSFLQM